MGGIEQRAAARVPCDIPVAINAEGRKVAASILDASRTGLRLRIPARELGVHRLSSLVQIAQRMSDAFGDSFEVEFLPDRLGGLVKRKLRPIRIGQRDWEHADVEVGCLLAAPLSDDEASMLGVSLPKVGEAPPVVPMHHEQPSTHAPTQKTRLQAYIQAGNGRGTAPLPTTAEEISKEEAWLRIPDIDRMAITEGCGDIARFVMAFDEAYGSRISIHIMKGDEHLWAGSVGIHDVELGEGKPRDARIGVRFEDPLEPAEMKRLGLVA
jgi:hypothetical protein